MLVIEPTFACLPLIRARAIAAEFPFAVYAGTTIQTGITGAFVII